MTLEKYMTYHRHDPGGHVTRVEIRNDAELKYHSSLVETGNYRYVAFAPHGEHSPAIHATGDDDATTRS